MTTTATPVPVCACVARAEGDPHDLDCPVSVAAVDAAANHPHIVGADWSKIDVDGSPLEIAHTRSGDGWIAILPMPADRGGAIEAYGDTQLVATSHLVELIRARVAQAQPAPLEQHEFVAGFPAEQCATCKREREDPAHAVVAGEDGPTLTTVDGQPALIDGRPAPQQTELRRPSLAETLGTLHELEAKLADVQPKFDKVKSRLDEVKKAIEKARSAVIEAADREVQPGLPL